MQINVSFFVNKYKTDIDQFWLIHWKTDANEERKSFDLGYKLGQSPFFHTGFGLGYDYD